MEQEKFFPEEYNTPEIIPGEDTFGILIEKLNANSDKLMDAVHESFEDQDNPELMEKVDKIFEENKMIREQMSKALDTEQELRDAVEQSPKFG